MLARAYLYYLGVYGQTDVTLEDGTALTKQEVIKYVDDCIANSGHGLISDFRNLWPYAYSNKDYGYAKENGLSWIGETGDNIETMFAYKYSTLERLKMYLMEMEYVFSMVSGGKRRCLWQRLGLGYR